MPNHKQSLLAIDIGNTNIKIAQFKGKRILKKWQLTTHKDWSVRSCQIYLKKLFRLKRGISPQEIKAIILCSVVPQLNPIFKKSLFKIFNKNVSILGEDILAPIKNLYKKPKQVGQDRLANAVAAVNKYGTPIIILDFGTALTFDVVSDAGEYIGGIIIPGLELSLQALIEKAQLLPKINLDTPKMLLGRETISSMKSGIVYGYSFMIEGFLRLLKRGMNKEPMVIATGGAARLISRYCRSIKRIERNLTLEGLEITYKMAENNQILMKRW